MSRPGIVAASKRSVRRHAAILAVLTVAALMIACAGAQAKTVTVGSPLTGSFAPTSLGVCGDTYKCTPSTPLSPVTVMQAQLSEPGAIVGSPVDGTVISYRVAAAEGTFAIQIVRSYTYQFWEVARSVASSAPTHISSSGVSRPIATHLAIRGGGEDQPVAIRNFGDGDLLGLANGGAVSAWDPPLVDGAPASIPPPWGTHRARSAFRQTVRYCLVPNLEGKSLGGARKTLTRADCRVGKLKQTNHVRDRREVIFQSVQPAFAISDTKPIKLWLSR